MKNVNPWEMELDRVHTTLGGFEAYPGILSHTPGNFG